MMRIHSVGSAAMPDVMYSASAMMAMASSGVVHTLCMCMMPSYRRVQSVDTSAVTEPALPPCQCAHGRVHMWGVCMHVRACVDECVCGARARTHQC